MEQTTEHKPEVCVRSLNQAYPAFARSVQPFLDAGIRLIRHGDGIPDGLDPQTARSWDW
ncbi:MAG: hypothetical protein GXY44_05980 [Phycisphaerales bacterium]|nr:hypothetical protein [Phycisphaerales bacterium]